MSSDASARPAGAPVAPAALPDWAAELVTLYESNAVSQFVLHGNVHDRLVLPVSPEPQLGSLMDFLLRVLLPGFDVVLRYDLGHGIRIEKGGDTFGAWPHYQREGTLPREPRASVEFLSHYFRYASNLARLGRSRTQVACVVQQAHLVAPAVPYSYNFDLSALALLMREWGTETMLTEHPLATFLLSENLNDLHPLLVNNSRAAHIKVPLPGAGELEGALGRLAPRFPRALAELQGKLASAARQLAGATLSSIESLLKTREYRGEAVAPAHLADLKKELVERDCNGLIEFIESDRSLDDLYGVDAIKAWVRQDIALWRQDDVEALPMGYLLCGPVGTGKTFLVHCLAGEAGVPVVRFKNFRDKWVGSSESNLERIFRLIHALGRCIVFIDEADQALGRRGGAAGDSGVSGRIYSMMAEEMGDTRNRGRILWVLASSRPDLIEVDLKRPGRVDVKIPIFPSTTPEEGFQLIRALCRKRRLTIPEEAFEGLRERVPPLMTPGAAEALAVKVYRLCRTRDLEPLAALRDCLEDYQNPVPEDVLRFQIGIAAQEASDLDFVPEIFRPARASH